MNLNELRNGLGDENLTEEDLVALQPLYLVSESLSKQDFYTIVKAIGIKSAKSLAKDIGNLECSVNRAMETERKLEKAEEDLEIKRRVLKAVSRDYSDLGRRNMELYRKHEKLVEFVRSIPDAEELFLRKCTEEAKAEFSRIMETD